ncbi:hypothetical protein CASFOL_003501 [Castilleja foliolosa]|uniref:Uncharacterized protein n=1 Tax=Castilleja foliolosa TaxID=1961234 RepID=A0ABD3EHC5_9LAMI
MHGGASEARRKDDGGVVMGKVTLLRRGESLGSTTSKIDGHGSNPRSPNKKSRGGVSGVGGDCSHGGSRLTAAERAEQGGVVAVDEASTNCGRRVPPPLDPAAITVRSPPLIVVASLPDGGDSTPAPSIRPPERLEEERALAREAER